jgi:uncharacterized protein
VLGRREIVKLLALAASVPAIYEAGKFLKECRSGRRAKGSGSAHILRYNELGKTGIKVSDIGFGIATTTDPQLLVDAYRRGINYFDISPIYTWSVEMLAGAFALDPEMRKNAVIASRVECLSFTDHVRCFGQISDCRNCNPGICLDCIDEILKKLGRPHIDILHLHGVGEAGTTDLDLLDPNSQKGRTLFTFFESLKRQGKLRVAGITTHGPCLTDAAFDRAVQSGNFGAIMSALNYMLEPSPDFEKSLRTAEEHGVGVSAMKVLANAQSRKIPPETGRPLSHAAIAWALSQPGVNNVVIHIDNWEMLEEYLGASDHRLSMVDRFKLARHRKATSNEYCRVGCGRCLDSCPHGVEIATVLRIDQYRTNYRLPDLAALHFRSHAGRERLRACIDCKEPKCEEACPFGLSVQSRLQTAYTHFAGDGRVLA